MVSLGEDSSVSTRRPAGNGLGGEGSLASASEPSGVRRRGDGDRLSMVPLGEDSSVSTSRPAGKGMGGDGSLATASPLVGKRDNGSLSSSGFPPSRAYLGKGLGGDGSVVFVSIGTNLCGALGSLPSNGGGGPSV